MIPEKRRIPLKQAFLEPLMGPFNNGSLEGPCLKQDLFKRKDPLKKASAEPLKGPFKDLQRTWIVHGICQDLRGLSHRISRAALRIFYGGLGCSRV